MSDLAGLINDNVLAVQDQVGYSDYQYFLTVQNEVGRFMMLKNPSLILTLTFIRSFLTLTFITVKVNTYLFQIDRGRLPNKGKQAGAKLDQAAS